MKHWMALFGTPRKILSDNGSEFNNETLTDLAEQLNTTVMTTATEAPWSNGEVERHNAVIGNMAEKTISDTKCSSEIEIALQNVHGYSPNQLVFGRNPNFPPIVENKPPALEGYSSSELVASHLNAMHSATKVSDHKTRIATALTYQSGDVVYCKQQDSNCWNGPGKVISVDGKVVFVRHDGTYVRVHMHPSLLTLF